MIFWWLNAEKSVKWLSKYTSFFSRRALNQLNIHFTIINLIFFGEARLSFTHSNSKSLISLILLLLFTTFLFYIFFFSCRNLCLLDIHHKCVNCKNIDDDDDKKNIKILLEYIEDTKIWRGGEEKAGMECYSGGSIFGAIFGTIVVIALLGVLAWWIYKKYYLKHQKGRLMTLFFLASFN